MSSSRWPPWVYSSGEEPDYRFSFANERTFLAWIRTALALVAGGVAVNAFDLSMNAALQQVLAAVLLVLGAASALSAWVRWARSERAIRQGQPLPPLMFTAVLAGAVLVTALTVLVVGL